MKLRWILYKEDKEIEIKVKYNVYLRKGSISIEGEEISLISRVSEKSPISFEYDNQEYRIQFIPAGYGYIGELTTPNGQVISSKGEDYEKKKAPFWVFGFIIVNMSIPVLSVEAFTPWVIGILSSFLTVKFAKQTEKKQSFRLAAAAVLSAAAWCGYYSFYILVRCVGIHGGFLSFK